MNTSNITNYKPKDFAELIGVSVKTLQRWDREGILEANRTPTDRRYYTYDQYLQFKGIKTQNDIRQVVIYARVSTKNQKDDLQNQVSFLRQFCNARGTQNRKDTLMTYLEDGHCSLSNNLSENAIRPFTIGRKNWLFSASPKGATASAIVYTMVEMAKANDLNTYKYLTYLLSQRPNNKMSDEQLEQLAPWSETAKANCQN